MVGVARYVRLWASFSRFALTRELAFRGNFLVKVFVEFLWFAILVVFYDTVFRHMAGDTVATWSRDQYFFFVGCYFTLQSLMEALFLSNCGEFAELIRSGDLDFVLLKPIDEQFLVSCRDIEWAAIPSALQGVGLMVYALAQMGWAFDPLRLLLFLALFCFGLALAYSFMLILASASVWMVRNQSLYEVWWLFSTLMRYPREIYAGTWAALLARLFTYLIPIAIVTGVPAAVMVKVLEPEMVAFMAAATVVMLYVSRRFFRFALKRYRSASS
jgi:ABC-2 type transport system permease protein